MVRRIPGLRVAGAFDGFELAVRAILGQQVSVKGATTLAGRWAQAFGAPIATPYAELNRLSPSAQHMAGIAANEISALGIVGARARCLAALAPAVLERKVALTYAPNVEEQIEALMSLPGVGPVDGAVHRHAGAALAGRVSQRRSHADESGKRQASVNCRNLARGVAPMAGVRDTLSYGNHSGVNP